MSNEENRVRLGSYIRDRRRALFGSVENAIRTAGVNRATWNNAEAGNKVRDDRLTAIEGALGWNPGDAWRVMAGQEPTAEIANSPQVSTHLDLRRRIQEDPKLSKGIRRAMLALLDSQELDDQDRDSDARGNHQGEVRGA